MAIKLDRETLEGLLKAGLKKVQAAGVTASIAKVIRRSPKLRRFVRGPLADFAEDITTLASMVKDYATGEYREVPQRTILTASFALLYLLDPIDLIPDFIPGLGLMDDAAVLTLVVKALQSDLQNYRGWSQKLKRGMRHLVARI